MKKNTVSMMALIIASSLIMSPVVVSAETAASMSNETPAKKAHVTYVAVKRDSNSTSSPVDIASSTSKVNDDKAATGTIKSKESASTTKNSKDVKKAPAKKAPAKKAPVKKAPVKKAPVKKATVKTPVKKTNQ